MSQWSEKIPKENLSETVSSTRYFFGSFKIQINNFRKSFKKFIVDLLTRNVALNLSGALFFVGLGYSLKWWYKDQLFVILVKQNLPALSESESHQTGSWETGEAILNGEDQTWTPLIGRIDLYANHVRVKFKQPWQKHVYERFLGVFGESAQINVCKKVLTTKDWWKETNSVSNNSSPGELKKNTPLHYNANSTPSELYVPFQGQSSFSTRRFATKISFLPRTNGLSEAEVSFANRTPFYISPLNMENSEEIESKERNNFFGGVYGSKKVINVVNKFSTYTPEKPIFPKRWFKLSPRNLCFLNLDNTLHSCNILSLASDVQSSEDVKGDVRSKSTRRFTSFANSSVKQRRGRHKKSETAITFSYPLQLTKKLTGWQPSPNLLVLNSYSDEIPYKLENTFQSYFPKKDSQLLFLSTSFRKAISLPTTSFLLIKSIKPITSLQSFSSRPNEFLSFNGAVASQGQDGSTDSIGFLSFAKDAEQEESKVTVPDSIRVKALTLYLPNVQILEDGKTNRGLTLYETLHSFNILSLRSYGDVRSKVNISFGQDVSKERLELARNETKIKSFTLTESKAGSLPTISKKQTSLIINPCFSNINNAFDSNYTPQFLLKEVRPINGVNTFHNENRPFLTSRPCEATPSETKDEMSRAQDEMLTLLRQGEPFSAKQKAKLRTAPYQNQSEEIRVINCKNSHFLDLSTKLINWETHLCQYLLSGEISKKENNEAKQLGSKDLLTQSIDLVKETPHKISFNKFLLPTKQTETYLKQSHLFETKKLLQNQLALLCKAFPINFVEKSGGIVKDSPKGVRQSIDLVDDKSIDSVRKLNNSNVFATFEIGNESNLFERNDHHLVNVTKKILKVQTNQQKGPKGALLFANSTLVNDVHALKREGFIDEVNRLDPLLLLNTLGFTFNNFRPLTHPPILLANSKLVTPFTSLGLANLFKSGVNINSIAPHQKFFTCEEKLRVPPVLCVQRKGFGVRQSNLKKYRPLFYFLSQRLCNADAFTSLGITDTFANELKLGFQGNLSMPSEAKLTSEMLAKGTGFASLEQEKYVSFYFNPKNLNWVIFQQSTNYKFNSLLKKIAGETNQLVTTQSTHLIFEFLKEKRGLSSLPNFASPVGLTKQHKTKRAFTPTDSLETKACPKGELAPYQILSDIEDVKEGAGSLSKEAELFTGPITSNEPGCAEQEETESIINADALVPQNISSEAKELEAKFLDKSYQSETGVLQNCLPLHFLSSARQKLALLRGLRSWEVDKFTTISNINKINLKLKETKLETLKNINVVDKGINFDQNSRYMSGYVYPDIQSNFLKAHLDQWFAKNNNFYKFNSFAPTRFQRNEMIGILDKACLSYIEILNKKIKPTTFTSLHIPSAKDLKLTSCAGEPAPQCEATLLDDMLTKEGQDGQAEVLHSLQSKGNILSLASDVQSSEDVKGDVTFASDISSEGVASQGQYVKGGTDALLSSSALLKGSLFMPSEAEASVKKAEIKLLPYASLKNIGNIEVPYKKFNHYLAKFPGFSDPSQFFTTLPQISCGNENLGNKSQDFASFAKVGMPTANLVDFSTKSIDKSEINKLFIQKKGCDFRKVAYSGLVVQRNKWTKDFQPFKDSKKLLDGASKSSIWGTFFLGPENPLTNRQCHFFGQKQLSTLDTNSLQRDYLRQLGKEILTQSNSKGYTELSKFSSIERTKILSLSKKVNSFFFKKRKYSYLLEPKDQWHLLFQEQLCTALEDGKKYPSSSIHSFDETNTASYPKEEKLSNFKDSFGSGRIKISAPLVMAHFPKKLVQSDRVYIGKAPQPRKSVPPNNAKGSVLRSQGFELARNDNYVFQQVSSKAQAIHTDSFANEIKLGEAGSLLMSQLPSYRLEQGISWRPFCHLQRSYLLNDALLTSSMLVRSKKGEPTLCYKSKVSTSNPFLVKQRTQNTGVKITPRLNEFNQNKLSELGEDFANSITSNETSELGYRQLKKTNGVLANPLQVVMTMSPYFSYLPSGSFEWEPFSAKQKIELHSKASAPPLTSCERFFETLYYVKPSETKDEMSEAKLTSSELCTSEPKDKISVASQGQTLVPKQAIGVKAPTLSVYPERLLLQYAKGLLGTRSQELRGNENSQSLKLISHYPLFTERFTEEINTVPYLNKKSLFYLPTYFLSNAKQSFAKELKLGVKSPNKFILTEGLGVHKSTDSVSFADPISAKQKEWAYEAALASQGKGVRSSALLKGSLSKAKPSMNSLLGIQNMCTSLLIQEPSVSSCSASFAKLGKPWAVLNQWIFLIALLFWIEQTLLDNVFPALFALEQILLSAAGIKTGGNNRSDGLRISKNETPKFHNLAGIDGLLGELSELVLFLRGQRNLGVAKLNIWNNTDSFNSLGGALKSSLLMPLNKKNSYGVLLTGSPGTGKTFLVRALANEANVPVLILSASTLTTSKLNNNKPSWSIRHAFKRAKQLAPCILFIDEIDALGKSRGKIVTDINEIVADTNLTSASSLGHKRMFTSVSHSFASPVGRAQLMFSYEQFGQNCSNFTTTLFNKWEYPLQSTILQESNEINQNSLCQEKLVDLLKIASPSLGQLAGIRNTILNDVQDSNRKGSELTDSSRSKKESTTDFSDDLSYPKGHPSEAQQQLPTREKEMTRGKFGPLTQLLVSMDGVSSFSGVLIMGATNRPELLDPALTRPGRFEKIIRIDKPSEQNRIEILQLYSQNLGVQQQIPWAYLATRTIGLTTADLAVAMNYSSLRAIIQGSVHTLETIEYGLNCITRL